MLNSAHSSGVLSIEGLSCSTTTQEAPAFSAEAKIALKSEGEEVISKKELDEMEKQIDVSKYSHIIIYQNKDTGTYFIKIILIYII